MSLIYVEEKKNNHEHIIELIRKDMNVGMLFDKLNYKKNYDC